MNGYTKLFNSIIVSTIWEEDDQTRIVWITMLAMADQHGEVMASVPGLAKMAKVPIDAAEKALGKFMAPDQYSRSPEFEGRRIQAIIGGWEILNHRKYREMASEEDRAEQSRIRMQRFRERQKDVTLPLRKVTQCYDKQKQKQTQKQKQEKNTGPVVSVPGGWSTPEFEKAWSDWQADRRERKKPLTSRAVEMQLKKLKAHPVAIAVQMIEQAIEKGWTGIYDLKPATTGKSKWLTPNF